MGYMGEIMKVIIGGIIEMTSGCLGLSKLSLNATLTALVACGIITFGGLSIHLQSNIFLSEIGIKYNYFLRVKISQTFIAILICALLCLFT